MNVAHRFRIGDTWIQVFDDGWTDDDLKAPTEFRPRHESRAEYGVLPLVDLELLNSSARGTQWPINRIITLVGRDPRCRICCADENISKVHCAFLLLPTGLWIIDSHLPPPGSATGPVEGGYMANAWMRMRHPDYDTLRQMLDQVGRTVKVRAR